MYIKLVNNKDIIFISVRLYNIYLFIYEYTYVYTHRISMYKRGCVVSQPSYALV